jgi:CubicO group peptidase (beta-lactamase class C family)
VPQWLKRIRSALVVGLVWGGLWALVGGGIMESFIDPRGDIVDMWPQVLGIVGFVGGVIFSGVIALVAGHRKLGEFSFAEFAGLGAVAGVLQGAVAMALVGAPALFIGLTTLVSAVAASGSLAVARMAGQRQIGSGGNTGRLGVVLALLFSAPAAGAQSRSAMVQRIDSIAGDVIARQRAVGMVVAVMQGSDTLMIRPYGKADVEWDVPMPADAMFEIGSQAKQFTAVMILQLRDAGKLSLDDDITKWLPDFDTRGHGVPLRRLLNHTSGIHDLTETVEFASLVSNRAWPRDSAYALIKRQPFDFAPGAMQQYSNSGFWLLGLVVEKASGMKYEDYLEQKLFAPLGMTRSMYCDSFDNMPRRAHGYGIQAGKIYRMPTNIHTWSFAAGAVCSTAADLLTWNNALHGGRVLSPASYAEMTSQSSFREGMELRYGYGLGVERDPHGRRVFNHGGILAGFWTETLHFPDAQTTVVVLLNNTGGIDPEVVARQIGDAVIPAPFPTPRVFTGDATPFLGTYKGKGLRGDLTVAVTQGPQGLMVSGNGSTPRPTVWIDGNTFFLGEIYLTFGPKGPTGQATELGFNPAKGLFLVLTRE